MKDLSKLEQRIGVKFDNQDLLLQSLAHRSYLNENPSFQLDHNERLEFLGDAVLELIVTENLFKNYNSPEGEVAEEINLNDFVLLSRGEAKDTGRARQCILANAMEALIGAIYLDQGFEAVKIFIEKNILTHLPQILETGSYRDAKSVFQEEAQERVGITPSYEVLKEWGPDHAKHFKIGVFLESELVAEGEGSSKQEGQQQAAENALRVKEWNGNSK